MMARQKTRTPDHIGVRATCIEAHALGDPNRSARLERSFRYIETDFLAGHSFRDWTDANQQARAWCDKGNAKFRDDPKASPRELFAVERPHLKPLPVGAPPVYLRSPERARKK
jgi:hypothetical protein